MTLLVASLAVENLKTLKTHTERAWRDGAGAVELRIDRYDGDLAALAGYLAAHRDRTWIVTCRSTDEGGKCPGDAMQRAARAQVATGDANTYVDFELADWLRSPDIRQVVRQTCAPVNGPRRRIILSAHDPPDVTASLQTLIQETTGADDIAAGKLAYGVDHILGSFAALDGMHEHGDALSAIAVGEDGTWTRILAKKLGAFATYASLDPASATAPGQLTVRETIERYRWHSIDPSTRVFGVIGDPIAHSMSPLLFNRWFAEAGVNAIYLPLRVRGGGDAASRFLDACRDRPWLDVGGMSVTIPHKTAALQWVGDCADHMARGVGAVNTLWFHGQKAQGFNTDCDAALSSLTDALGRVRSDLRGLSVDVLGTGGAARSLLYGLSMFGCDVTVYGRSPERTKRIAEEFDVRPAPWDQRVHGRGQVLINGTSIGLWSDANVSPMPPESLPGRHLVFDLVYHPVDTRLLKDAAAAGVETLSGVDMFVRQAAMQFTLWTGRSPDTGRARELIRSWAGCHAQAEGAGMRE